MGEGISLLISLASEAVVKLKQSRPSDKLLLEVAAKAHFTSVCDMVTALRGDKETKSCSELLDRITNLARPKVDKLCPSRVPMICSDRERDGKSYLRCQHHWQGDKIEQCFTNTLQGFIGAAVQWYYPLSRIWMTTTSPGY